MPTSSRVPFALLVALAMLLLWGGTATADDTPPPAPPGCLTDPALETCLPSGDDPMEEDDTSGAGNVETTGDDAGDDAGDDSTGAPDGADSGPLGEGTPSDDTAVPALPGGLTGLQNGESPEQDDDDAGPADPAGDQENAENGDEPDPDEVVSCIGDAIEQFLVDLQAALGDDADELLTEIETGLGSSDPTEVLAFLQDLPTLVEEAGPDVPAAVQALLIRAAEDIAACLPEPPAVEPPPTEEPPTQEPPTAAPVVQPAVHYDDCDDARAHGAAPVHSTDPGYAPHLDADHDGIGCEDNAVVPVATTTGGGQLAYTGAEFGPQLALGGLLLLLGSALLLAARRRA